ncbi:MAG: hypothetical protein ACTSPE_11430 [Candidatus Thorarchaeota archaeon]
MEVNFEGEIMSKIQELADEAGVKPEGLIEIVMREFARNTGGRVYVGRWSKGEVDGVKGMRYVVQWPFRPGFIEAPGDLVKRWRKE